MNTLVPLKFNTSYDSTMNYDDMCRKVCHRDCAEEAGLVSELDDTFLYCSQECKNKGDKYCNEELQNNTPKTYNNNNNNNITIDNIYSHLVFYIYMHVIVNYAICNVIHRYVYNLCIIISGILGHVCFCDSISIALYCSNYNCCIYLLIDCSNDRRWRWFPRRTYSIIIIVVANHTIIININGKITSTCTVVG